MIILTLQLWVSCRPSSISFCCFLFNLNFFVLLPLFWWIKDIVFKSMYTIIYSSFIRQNWQQEIQINNIKQRVIATTWTILLSWLIDIWSKPIYSLRAYIALISWRTDTILSPYSENKQLSWLLALAENIEQIKFSEALNLCKNLAVYTDW